LIEPHLGDLIGWVSENGGRIGTNTQPCQEQPPTGGEATDGEGSNTDGLSGLFAAELNQYMAQRTHSDNEPPQITSSSSKMILHLKTLWLFTQIRGFAIIKYFPNHFDLFPKLFILLQDLRPLNMWECDCMIWLWLAHLTRNPFPMSSLATDASAYIHQCYNQALPYFNTPTKVKMCVAEFLSRFMNRRDVIAHGILHQFMNLAQKYLLHQSESGKPSTVFFKITILRTLVLLMKNTPDREILLPHLSALFEYVSVDMENENTLMKHLHTKFTQRIGLMFLKPIIVSWRYQKSRQRLLANLSRGSSSDARASTVDNAPPPQEDDEDIEVPDETELVLDKLIQGLRDKDTVVRWSAAKGVGRITMRLPKDMGDDVVSFVLELLSEDEDDGAWHGGCLALAELARRGLLLPARLDDVIPPIMEALQYDVRRGAHSVGAHVRDSACYVCWAFARAYSPEIFKPYVSKLATGLMKTAVFDREVNCRRAASAAFQENVGRQGNFPHGIDILTRADYFTLSNISTAYLDISDYIAQFDEYKLPLINHLVETKIAHWDKAIRVLASKALGVLAHRDERYMAENVLHRLLPLTLSDELETRHGSLLAVAEIVLNLSHEHLPEGLVADILHILPNIEGKRLYRGKGGEIMREAVSRFIECFSITNVQLPAQLEVETGLGRKVKKGTRSIFQRTINDNLKHPNEEIIQQTLEAFRAFAVSYYDSETWVKKVHTLVIEPLMKELESSGNPAIRRGYTLALGNFPRHLIVDQYEAIGDLIMKQIPLEANPADRDAESRRNGVRALIDLCESMGAKNLTDKFIQKAFKSFLLGVEDYATDNRGDVGLWVREAAMDAMKRFIILLAPTGRLAKEMAATMMKGLLRQANEKIDRVREHAGKNLEELLNNESVLSTSCLPYQREMRKILLTNDESRDVEQTLVTNDDDTQCDHESSKPEPTRKTAVNWANPDVTFPLFAQLLHFSDLRTAILAGMVVSMGGLTRYVASASSDAVISFLKKHPEDKDAVAHSILQVMRDNHKVKRMITPALKMLTILISHESFSDLQPGKSTFVGDLILILQNELRGSKDIKKLLAAVPLVVQLIPFEEPARKNAFRIAFGLLLNGFPAVRIQGAEQLVSVVQTYGEDIMPEERVDEVLDLLVDCSWGERLDDVRDTVNQLRDLFGIKPLHKKKKAVPEATKPEVPSHQEKPVSKESIDDEKNTPQQDADVEDDDEADIED